MSNAIKRFFENGEFDCYDMVNHSSAYTDNDLKPGLRPAFQAHLSKCGPYQTCVGTLSSTIGALGKLPGISAPSTLKQSLIDRIRRKT